MYFVMFGRTFETRAIGIGRSNWAFSPPNGDLNFLADWFDLIMEKNKKKDCSVVYAQFIAVVSISNLVRSGNKLGLFDW